MPADRSRFTYRRIPVADNESAKGDLGKTANTWRRNSQTGQAATASASSQNLQLRSQLSTDSRINQPTFNSAVHHQRTVSASEFNSTSRGLVKFPQGSAASTAAAQGNRTETSAPGPALRTPLSPAKLSAHLYAKKRPHQLHRLSPSVSAAACTQAAKPAATAVVRTVQPTQPPLRIGIASPGPLIQKGKHALVRRTGLISAIARTVAAVQSPWSLKASRRWTRPGAQKLSTPPAPQSRTGQVSRPSRLGILRRPSPSKRAVAKLHAAGGGLKWQREQNERPSLRPTPRPSPRQTHQPSMVGAGVGGVVHKRSAYKQLQGGTAGRQKAGKLVRMGGSLYKVSGAGSGRSLRRQASPKAKPRLTSITQAASYQRQGFSLQRLLSSPSAQASPLQKLRRGLGSRRLSVASPSSRAKQDVRAAKLSVISKIRKRSKLFVNRVCYTFCRTGKCADKVAGICPLVHKPENVAVCLKWLQGHCQDLGCPLQHKLRKQLMPMCEHFAKGTCNNLDCPYLHVLLDEKAPICKEFAKGYCPKGASCLAKHLSQRQVMSVKAAKTLMLTRKAENIQEPAAKKRRRWPLPMSEAIAEEARKS